MYLITVGKLRQGEMYILLLSHTFKNIVTPLAPFSLLVNQVFC